MISINADDGEEENKLTMEDDPKSTTEQCDTDLHHTSILNSKATSSELSSFPGPMPTSLPMPPIPPPSLTRTTTALTLLPPSLPGGCLPLNKDTSGGDGADDASVESLGSSSSTFAMTEESGRSRPAKAAAIAAMALCSLSRSSQKPPPPPPPPPPPQHQLSPSAFPVSSIPSLLQPKRLQTTSQKNLSCGSNFKATALVARPAGGGRSYPTAIKKDKTTTGTNELKNSDNNNKKKSNSQAQLVSSTGIVSRVSTLPPRDEFGRFIKPNNIQKKKVVTTTKTTKKKTSSLSTATTTTAAKDPLLLGHFDLGWSMTKKKSQKTDGSGNTQSSSVSSSSVPRFLSVVTYNYSEDELRNTLQYSCNQDSVGFATRLWLLTHDMDRKNPDLMSWSSDGKSIVLCSDRLYEESGCVRMAPYITKYFQHNKLKSLRRQICYYVSVINLLSSNDVQDCVMNCIISILSDKTNTCYEIICDFTTFLGCIICR